MNNHTNAEKVLREVKYYYSETDEAREVNRYKADPDIAWEDNIMQPNDLYGVFEELKRRNILETDLTPKISTL